MRKNRADLTPPLPTTAFRALPSSIHYAAFGTLGSKESLAVLCAMSSLVQPPPVLRNFDRTLPKSLRKAIPLQYKKQRPKALYLQSKRSLACSQAVLRLRRIAPRPAIPAPSRKNDAGSGTAEMAISSSAKPSFVLRWPYLLSLFSNQIVAPVTEAPKSIKTVFWLLGDSEWNCKMPPSLEVIVIVAPVSAASVRVKSISRNARPPRVTFQLIPKVSLLSRNLSFLESPVSAAVVLTRPNTFPSRIASCVPSFRLEPVKVLSALFTVPPEPVPPSVRKSPTPVEKGEPTPPTLLSK